MFSLGFGEIVIICLILIVVVGPERLPSVMKSVGKTMRTVRQASRDLRETVGLDELMREDVLRPMPPPRRPPPATFPRSDEPPASPAPEPAPDAASASSANVSDANVSDANVSDANVSDANARSASMPTDSAPVAPAAVTDADHAGERKA